MYYPCEKKTRGERARQGKKVVSSHLKKYKGKIGCIKIDGKKSKTAIGNGKFKTMEHVTVIKEPSGKYLLSQMILVFCLF